MTKPANFPERKRQRQLGALQRRWPHREFDHELTVLSAAIAAGSQRDVRTKKDRSSKARMSR